MTIPPQDRVRPIVLALTFREVAENHILPMSQYAAHSRHAQLLIQMVDGRQMREEQQFRYRSVFGASAMNAEDIVTALKADPIIGENYEVTYIVRGSEQHDDLVTLSHRPQPNTPL